MSMLDAVKEQLVLGKQHFENYYKSEFEAGNKGLLELKYSMDRYHSALELLLEDLKQNRGD